MNRKYKKECYDSNSRFKIHYSHGIRRTDATLSYLHYDKDLIIEYFRRGETSIRIEGNVYTIEEGDLVITTPEELHVSLKREDCYVEKISIHVNESLLTPFSGDQIVFLDKIVNKKKGIGNLIVADTVKQLGMDITLNQCLSYAQDGSLESQVLLSCKIIELLSMLAKLIEESSDSDSPTSSNKIVNQMINYINRHYNEDVTLDVLANRFHFSKYYISHLFKDYVGVSPYDYLIIRRLYMFNDLVRSKQPIKEACFMVGFNNYSNFFRLYKKHFQITPQQFKNNLENQS